MIAQEISQDVVNKYGNILKFNENLFLMFSLNISLNIN